MKNSRQFVFVRGIAPDTYLLFLKGGDQPQSYTLRDYSRGGKPRLIVGQELPYHAGQLLKLAEDQVEAPDHDLDDDAFWHQVIMELNRHLASRVQAAGGRPAAQGEPVQGFRYPVLALPMLLHHANKGGKTEELAQILHSQRSGDWVTWNCARLLEGIDPAAWWPRLVELARADNPGLEITAEPRDLPELEVWSRHPTPAGYESAGERVGPVDAPFLAMRSAETAPAEQELEVDLAIGGQEFLVHVGAELDTEGQTLADARAQVARGVDVLLEAAQERRPAYWVLVRRTRPDQPHARALAEFRRHPDRLQKELPHRSAEQIEAVRKNMALLRWPDLVQYLREFYEGIFSELDRRARS